MSTYTPFTPASLVLPYRLALVAKYTLEGKFANTDFRPNIA